MERWRQYQSTVLIYAILLLVLSGMVVPLVWTLLTSFKYNVDVTLGWIPPRWTTDNYTGVFQRLLLPPLLRQLACSSPPPSLWSKSPPAHWRRTPLPACNSGAVMCSFSAIYRR